MAHSLDSLFGLRGKVAAVTGGGGILCSEMCRALGALGVKVAVLNRTKAKGDKVAEAITAAGGTALSVACDVTDAASVEAAREAVRAAFGPADFLINGAGGNAKDATSASVVWSDNLSPTFFELKPEAFADVFKLNFMGTLLPCQVFARDMAERCEGGIVNVSSMSGILPLTKVAGYSAAKAAIENFTKWLAVHFASAGIRVNAIAPGFFLTEQNRFLLTDEKTGALTGRGQTIHNNTPMRRFGEPGELIAGLVYLLGPGAKFVTGTTLAVDGGFSAFAGV